MPIEIARTDEEIAATFDVMSQLRPNLARESYPAVVRELMETEGYRIAAAREGGEVVAVAGYRLMTMLYRGRLLYVDDLVTDSGARSRGHGKALLAWLKEEGRRNGCNEIQLISRVTREHAHRFYFREGLGIECFHLRAAL